MSSLRAEGNLLPNRVEVTKYYFFSGALHSDWNGQLLVAAQKSQRGVTPSQFESQVDHFYPSSWGGNNNFKNARVLSRQQNNSKSNKGRFP